MRVRSGQARRRAKKRLFKEAKGNYAGRSKLWRPTQETIIRGRVFAYRDRRNRKREFRRLWIIRITAACRQRGLSYSVFMHAITKSGIGLNRKSLSELAIHHPDVFDEIVDAARQAVPA